MEYKMTSKFTKEKFDIIMNTVIPALVHQPHDKRQESILRQQILGEDVLDFPEPMDLFVNSYGNRDSEYFDLFGLDHLYKISILCNEAKKGPAEANEILTKLYDDYYNKCYEWLKFVFDVSMEQTKFLKEFAKKTGGYPPVNCIVRSDKCGIRVDPADKLDPTGYFTLKPKIDIFPSGKGVTAEDFAYRKSFFTEYEPFVNFRYMKAKEYYEIADSKQKAKEKLLHAIRFGKEEKSVGGETMSQVTLLKIDGNHIRVGFITYKNENVKKYDLTLNTPSKTVNEFNQNVLAKISSDLTIALRNGDLGNIQTTFDVLTTHADVRGAVIGYELQTDCLIAFVLQISNVGVRHLLYLIGNVNRSFVANNNICSPRDYAALYQKFQVKLEKMKGEIQYLSRLQLSKYTDGI